jgi:hypothetical protein
MLVDWLGDAGASPLRRATPAEMRDRLSTPLPAEGTAYEELLATLAGDVLPYGSRVSHPGFLAFIPGSGTWPSG